MTPDDIRVKCSRKALSDRQNYERNRRIIRGDIARTLPPEVARMFDVARVAVPLPAMAIDGELERLNPTGFRSSPNDVADDDMDALARVSGFWPAARMAMRDALSYGHGLLMIGTGADGGPRITAESPLNTTFLRDPLSGQLTAAQKEWRDTDEGAIYTATYTPQTTYLWRSKNTSPVESLMLYDTPIPAGSVDLIDEIPNPLGVVPITPVVNRPSTERPDGTSDVEAVEQLTRALCETITDSQTAMHLMAIPATMLLTEAQTTADQARQIKDSVLHAMSAPGGMRALVVGGGGRLEQLDPAELTNFRTEAELLVDLLAAMLALPNYWVRGNVANPVSGESIRSAEYRLTMRVRERQRWFSPALADAIRLAQRVRDGFWDARLASLETIWANAEPRTIAMEADAISKLVGANVLDHRAALAELDIAPLEAERIIAAVTPPTIA